MQNAIEQTIAPRTRDLGGFSVRRVLPAAQRQLVGPFIFFDRMGPAQFNAGEGIDVRPHPHIGLATITWLFDGEFLHCDSLSNRQIVYPGEVNWMVAGRAITHSERTSSETRAGAHSLSGIQAWVALPGPFEDTCPRFEHRGQQDLPQIEDNGTSVRLIVGSAYGVRAPVTTFSEMFYADAILAQSASLPLPDDHEDRGLYIVEGCVKIANETFQADQMLVFRSGESITVTAGTGGARVMLLGGDTVDGPRHIWWNFVSSSREKIEYAKEQWKQGDWSSGLFSLPEHDQDEYTPLPE